MVSKRLQDYAHGIAVGVSNGCERDAASKLEAVRLRARIMIIKLEELQSIRPDLYAEEIVESLVGFAQDLQEEFVAAQAAERVAAVAEMHMHAS